jgi:hypothetical protein
VVAAAVWVVDGAVDGMAASRSSHETALESLLDSYCAGKR